MKKIILCTIIFQVNDARDFLPVLKKAKSAGLRLALHLAEVSDVVCCNNYSIKLICYCYIFYQHICHCYLSPVIRDKYNSHKMSCVSFHLKFLKYVYVEIVSAQNKYPTPN